MVSSKPPQEGTEAKSEPPEFHGPVDDHGFDDGRKRWEWQTRYSQEAHALIKGEAKLVGSYLVFFLLLALLCAGLSGQKFAVPFGDHGRLFHIEISLIAVFVMGGLGGTTFSIKWLMHSIATGKWHQDRYYWRLFVPMIGGIYAVIVLNLISAGLVGGGAAPRGPHSPGTAAVLAFLVGYFSDGVSGLLTNVANAVFGTVQKK